MWVLSHQDDLEVIHQDEWVLLFSRLVMSDSLQPHAPQFAERKNKQNGKFKSNNNFKKLGIEGTYLNIIKPRNNPHISGQLILDKGANWKVAGTNQQIK